jgi:predicted dehydrogenase
MASVDMTARGAMGASAVVTRVGVIGCGNISTIYLKNTAQLPGLQLVACADLVPERAQERAAEHGIQAMTVEGLLADPGIDMIVNLTIPAAHAPVNLAALHQGKHVYTEKPLATTRADGQRTIDLAAERGLRVGAAPDTFLGAGLQTCRKLIDDGAIGVPVAAVAFMAGHGPEGWHPSPDFFYKPGAGPMFDMGPYYLTALVSLLGPVVRVTGSTRISFPERLITGPVRNGETITVETPTHLAGVLDFASGAVGTIITSFDVWAHNLPRIEIYGSAGSLCVPDPNTFGGPVKIRLAGEKEWADVALTHGYDVNSRGLGAADMALAVGEGRPHRASGELSMHVLDLMSSFQEASESDRHVRVATTCERPAPMAPGLAWGELV